MPTKQFFLVALILALPLPPSASADDAATAAQAVASVQAVVSASPFLADSLGITVLSVAVGEEHPEWVHLDFPWTTSTGRQYKLIDQAMRTLIANGAEPSVSDSTLAGGGYIREFVVGRVMMHAGQAIKILQAIAQNGLSPTASVASVPADSTALWWRNLLRDSFTDGRF